MGEVEAIKKAHSRAQLVKYLGSCLGYRMTDVSYLAGQLNIPSKPSEAIRSVRLLSDYDKAFQTYLFETTSLTRTTIRSILEPFYRHHPAGDYLFIFTKDYSQLALVSPQRILRPGKPMPTLQLRILPVEPDNLYHTDLEVLNGISLTPADQKPEVIRTKHGEAFSVERVTDEFFETYKRVLNQLKAILAAQRKGNANQVHAFAQQLLNRLMFLYFLQKKGWLKWGEGNPDKRYMRNLWREYGRARPSDGSFYRLWLKSLFFHAFNKRSSLMPVDLPGEIRASFLNMPFLNGGLFAESDLDRLGFDVPDDFFAMLFDRNVDGTLPGFLERYNFTIQESLPLEVEVAVDPEMLGKVYESLINEEDRHQAGIFYTPRIEIDYMCRLSLIEYLHDATGLSKDSLIPLVMAPMSEDGRNELAGLPSPELNRLKAALDSVRVVDPAVGSGSFLVGMMNVMVQLYRAIAEYQGHHENEFALKKRIVSQNLYGVDVKDWAVRVCELRLWLSLIIESEESQMDIYNQPLLPNLTFKARQGDSLVEEIAGIPLSLRADYAYIPQSLKQQIRHIVDKKEDYFRGDRSVSRHDIEYLEHDLLRNVLDTKIKTIDSEIRKLEAPQQQAFQAGLEQIRGSLDMIGAVLKGLEEARAGVQPQIDPLREERARLQKVAASIGKRGEKDYFLWDIDFAEVFLEKGGFDICIGNPPYVRQEEVAPPLAEAEDYDPDDWREVKRGYKEQLERAVRTHWGSHVGKIDKKSDLYVYFYYQGLDLLRPGGLFCFINSNSWLDVGYGASLQEFLLRNIAIKQVIDNHARRSFKESLVNTVIVVLQRAGKDRQPKEAQAKFIAYRQPFEAAVNAENLLLEEWADSVQSTQEFRVYPISQGELWLDGLEVPEEEKAPSLELGAEHGKYIGGKWGGKYLRAPDIFFTILEKGKAKLVRLGDIAEVRRGFTTGANEFFYLEDITGRVSDAHVRTYGVSRKDTQRLRLCRNDAEWEGLIEAEFLEPILRRPRECECIRLEPEHFQYKVFLCHEDRANLRGTCALKYIQWGEARDVDERPTCRSRPRWYDIGKHELTNIAAKMTTKYRHYFPASPVPFLVDNRFYEVRFPSPDYLAGLVVSLNSAVTALSLETAGRAYGGGGGPLDIKVYEMKRIMVVDPRLIDTPRPLWDEDIAKRPILHFWKEAELADRRELDKFVFEALGLTDEEQLAVYRAVVELVKNRLLKARSV